MIICVIKRTQLTKSLKTINNSHIIIPTNSLSTISLFATVHDFPSRKMCGLMINQSLYCQFAIIEVLNHTDSQLVRETNNVSRERKDKTLDFCLASLFVWCHFFACCLVKELRKLFTNRACTEWRVI